MGWFSQKPNHEIGDLDALHREVQTHDPYPNPSAHGNGIDGWAPRVGKELPPIANQDRILVHFDRPPADQAPERYYQDRNESFLRRGQVENLRPENFPEVQKNDTRAPDPRWTAPQEGLRPTTRQSPSNYRFTRPFDQKVARHLNGLHFSMASMHRSYPINGMQPPRRFRNTWRLEPPPNDMQMADMPADSTPDAVVNTYVSPQVSPSRGAYRL